MTTHSSILAWKTPQTGAWRATVHGIAELDATERTHIHTHTHSRDNSALDSILLIKYKLLLELILILRLISNH